MAFALLIAPPADSRVPAHSGSFKHRNGIFGRNFPATLVASESEVVG
jgi:hypothetical protein